MVQGEGLRARKKRATENAIERTAVKLALSKGHARVTVAEICEGADISRSTFFNYMPSRESAIFGKPLKMIPYEQAAAMFAEHAEESLLRKLFRVAKASVGAAVVNAEVNAGRNQLAMEQPDSLPMILAPFTTLTTDLTGLLFLWLEEDHSRRTLPEVSTLREAMLIVSTVATAMQTMLAELGGTEDAEIMPEAMEETVVHLAKLAEAIRHPA